MEITKYYNEHGEVAVLYSPRYGAGWSTWNGDNSCGEFLMFDKGLVQYAIDDTCTDEVDSYLKSKGVDVYTGGWEDIRIKFLPKGTRFLIEEYDGNESITILDDVQFNVA